MLILSLHNLANTYKMLPSQIIAQGNTLDMYVLDVATRWVKYQQEQADGKESLTKRSAGQPSQQELLDMVAKVKKKRSE